MSVDLIAAFNAAETWQDALAAVKDTAYFEVLFEDPEVRAVYSEKLTDLQDNPGREQAIGNGVNEVRKLFSDFETIEEIRAVVQMQIDVEHAKQAFIDDVMVARTPDELKTFLKDHLTLLNNHRQELIEDWNVVEGNPAVTARVAELRVDTYTIWLEQLTARLSADINDQFLNDLCTNFVVNRGDSNYFGVYPLLQNLDRAGDEASPVTNPDGLLADGSQVYLTQADEAGEITFTAASQSLWTDPDVLKVGTGLPASIKIAFDGPDFEGASIGRTTGVISEGGVVRTTNPTKNTADFFKMASGDGTTPGADLEIGNQVSFVYVINTNNTYTIYVDANGDGNLDANDVGFVVDAEIINTIGINPIGDDHFVDKFAPEAGALSITNLDDTGVSATDRITNDASFDLTLTGNETGSSVVYEVSKDGGEWTATTASQAALADGSYKFRATVTDQAGNKAVTSEISVTLDTTAPDAPALTKAGQGFSVDAGAAVTVMVDGEAAAPAALFTKTTVNGKDVYTARADAFTGAEDIDVSATLSDAAGNVSEAGVLENQSFDTTAPTVNSPFELKENATGNVVVAELTPQTGETFELTGGADKDLFNIDVDGKLVYIGGALDFETAEDKEFAVEITVKDAAGNTAIRAVTVNLVNVNEAPVAAANGNSASGNEDIVITGSVPAGTDVDAIDTKKYVLVAPVAGLTLNADGTFRYAPAADFNGMVEFQYQVVDAGGLKSAAQTFKLTVNAVNDAPRDIILSNASVLENSAAGIEVGKLTAVDPEGGAFTFTLLDNAGGRFVLDAATNTLKVASNFALDYEQAMSHTVRVQVKDAAGATYEETLTINIGDVSGEKVTGTSTSDVLTGNAGNDVFNAGAGNDSVSGGAGNDKLYGGSGNDKIRGGIGKDTLKGEAGKDTFVFDTTPGKSNVDKVLDFNVKDDSFWLDNAVFTKLGKKGTEASPAKLSKSFFTIGDKAKDKNDYVIYDDKKGKLFYDADGSGKGKQVEIATLSKNLKLTEKDFFIV